MGGWNGRCKKHPTSAYERKMREASLECGHTNLYHKGHEPKPGDYIYCVRCDTGSFVLRTNLSHLVKTSKAHYYILCMDCEWGQNGIGTREWSMKLARDHSRTRCHLTIRHTNDSDTCERWQDGALLRDKKSSKNLHHSLDRALGTA